MKRNKKILSLKKTVVSELNKKNPNNIQGGRLPLTQADTLCTTNAIICPPTIITCGD